MKKASSQTTLNIAGNSVEDRTLLNLGFSIEQQSKIISKGKKTLLDTISLHYDKLQAIGFNHEEITEIASSQSGEKKVSVIASLYLSLINLGLDKGQIIKILLCNSGPKNIIAVHEKFGELVSLGFTIEQVVEIARHVGGSNSIETIIKKYSNLINLGFDRKQITKIVFNNSGSYNINAVLENFHTLKEYGFSVENIVTMACRGGSALKIKAVVEMYSKLKELGYSIKSIVSIAYGGDGAKRIYELAGAEPSNDDTSIHDKNDIDDKLASTYETTSTIIEQPSAFSPGIQNNYVLPPPISAQLFQSQFNVMPISQYFPVSNKFFSLGGLGLGLQQPSYASSVHAINTNHSEQQEAKRARLATVGQEDEISKLNAELAETLAKEAKLKAQIKEASFKKAIADSVLNAENKTKLAIESTNKFLTSLQDLEKSMHDQRVANEKLEELLAAKGMQQFTNLKSDLIFSAFSQSKVKLEEAYSKIAECLKPVSAVLHDKHAASSTIKPKM